MFILVEYRIKFITLKVQKQEILGIFSLYSRIYKICNFAVCDASAEGVSWIWVFQ